MAMNESRDRAALRELADQYEAELRNVYVDDMPECMVKAREALAQPDPVPALVEALRRCVNLMAPYADEEDAAFEDGSMGAALISARAALKAVGAE